ncbi:MAG: hypothetical protein AAF892_08475 [Cyanobacteria bacterium P01_D01_bin.71]
MNILRIRHILGFAWFYLLAFVAAAVVVSTDANVGSLVNALLPSNLSSVIVFSLPIALLAVPTLVFFYRRQWLYGVVLAVVAAIVSWGVMLGLQTTVSPLTIGEVISLLPRVILVLGGWTLLVAFPAALLMNRN